jgi:microtubule-associated protein-like 6
MIRELASAVLSVAYNADGTFIACGLDNGMIYVLNSKGLVLSDVAQRQDRTLAINDLKFSRSGRYLATASSEGCCDVYDSMSAAPTSRYALALNLSHNFAF